MEDIVPIPIPVPEPGAARLTRPAVLDPLLAWRPFVELRQVVGDVVPIRLRANEDMRDWFDARIASGDDQVDLSNGFHDFTRALPAFGEDPTFTGLQLGDLTRL